MHAKRIVNSLTNSLSLLFKAIIEIIFYFNKIYAGIGI